MQNIDPNGLNHDITLKYNLANDRGILNINFSTDEIQLAEDFWIYRKNSDDGMIEPSGIVSLINVPSTS